MAVAKLALVLVSVLLLLLPIQPTLQNLQLLLSMESSKGLDSFLLCACLHAATLYVFLLAKHPSGMFFILAGGCACIFKCLHKSKMYGE